MDSPMHIVISFAPTLVSGLYLYLTGYRALAVITVLVGLAVLIFLKQRKRRPVSVVEPLIEQYRLKHPVE